MKKVLLILMAVSAFCTAVADDKVQVILSDRAMTYNVDDVLRIGFEELGVTVYLTEEGGDTYLFGDLDKILFHPTNTAVQQVVENQMKLFVARDGSFVSVRGWDGKQADVSIYSVNGQRVFSAKQWQGTDIDVSGLAHGVYVIKVGDKSAKFRK